MAQVCRNTMNGKKRQASVLGSTLTSITLNSDSSSNEESDLDSENDSSYGEDATEDDSIKHMKGDDTIGKQKRKDVNNATVVDKPKQKGIKESSKPKVRMKTLTIDGQLVYFCVLCDKIFTRKKDKINHELAHSNETLLSCPECGKDFIHGASLANHIKTHDGEQLHFCDLCPKMFAQNHQLKAHILTHSQPTNFPCKVCNTDYDSVTELKNHFRTNIKEEMLALWCDMCKIFCCRIHCTERDLSKIHAYRCEACNELFYTLKKLKLHSKKYAHKSFGQYRRTFKMLDIAEKENCSKRKLLQGKSSHVNIKRQVVEEKSSTVESEKSKKRPVPNHRSEDLFESDSEVNHQPQLGYDFESCSRKSCKVQRKPYCKKCNRSFKDSLDLVSHKLSTHCESPVQLICPICRQEFTSNNDLELHMSMHKADPTGFHQECSLCHRTFSSKVQLNEHYFKVHSPKKSQCFEGSDVELEHEANQLNNSEVFECHICAKVFSFHHELQNHLRLHTNIRSFQCYICHRSFVTKHYLQCHLQIHISDGNFVESEPDDSKKRQSEEKPSDSERRNLRTALFNKEGSDDVIMKSDKALTEVKIEKGLEMNIMSDDKHHESGQSFSQFGFDVGILSSASDENVCSFLAKDSERSDGCQFSSGSSRSFKISMAKERRKLRKKKHILKSPLRQCLANLREHDEMFEDRSDIIVDNLKEEQEEDQVKNLTVEINGVISEHDMETTLFVELAFEKKLIPKVVSLLYLSGIDQQNELAGFDKDCDKANNGFYSDSGNFSSINDNEMGFCEFEKFPFSTSSGNVISLDLELNDVETENYLSHFDTDGNLSNSINENVNKFEMASIDKKDDVVSERYSKYIDSEISSPDKIHFNSICIKEETESLQPLHSLSLMAARFSDDENKTHQACFIPGKIKDTNKSTSTHVHKGSLRTSLKTCRDIAASWKSSRNSNLKNKSDSSIEHSVSQSHMHYSHKQVALEKNKTTRNGAQSLSTHGNNSKVNEFPTSIISSSTCRSESVIPCPSNDVTLLASSTFDLKKPSPRKLFVNTDTCSSFSSFKPSSKDFKDNSFSMQSQPCSISCHQIKKSPSKMSSFISNVTGPSVHTSNVISDATSIQNQSIFHFDTDNPMLRNMNLMDMVSSIQTTAVDGSQNGHSSNDLIPKIKTETIVNDRSFSMSGMPSVMCSLPGNVNIDIPSQPQLPPPTHIDIFGGGSAGRGFDNNNSLPPFNVNGSMNVKPLNTDGLFNNANNIYGTPSQTDLPLSTVPFNRVSLLESGILNNNMLSHQLHPSGNARSAGRLVNPGMDSILHHNNPTLHHQGQMDMLSPNLNLGHLGFGSSLPSVPMIPNPIPMMPEMRNPGENIFMGPVIQEPTLFQPGPGLSLAYGQQSSLPVFRGPGFSPFSSTGILPNAGFVPQVVPPPRMTAGVFYLPM